MFAHYKTSAAAIMRVRMFDTDFAPVTGISQGSVTVTLLDTAGSATTLTVTTHYTWTEVTTGAFSGQGVYVLTLNASLFSTAGEYTVACSGGTGKSVSEFAVYSALAADAKSSADTAASNASTAASNASTAASNALDAKNSADTAASNASTAASNASTASTAATLARKMLTNKGVVSGSNQYIVYDDDNTTPLKTYNTKDVNGNPSSTSIFQRIPV